MENEGAFIKELENFTLHFNLAKEKINNNNKFKFLF